MSDSTVGRESPGPDRLEVVGEVLIPMEGVPGANGPMPPMPGSLEYWLRLLETSHITSPFAVGPLYGAGWDACLKYLLERAESDGAFALRMSPEAVGVRAWQIARYQCFEKRRAAAIREICDLVGEVAGRSDLSNVSLTPEQLDDWSKVPD